VVAQGVHGRVLFQAYVGCFFFFILNVFWDDCFGMG
jgi:hypothetical protein